MPVFAGPLGSEFGVPLHLCGTLKLSNVFTILMPSYSQPACEVDGVDILFTVLTSKQLFRQML
jgi:hypothetical protein